VQVPAELRDRVLGAMSDQGIGVAVNYQAVHTLTYYRDRFGYARDAFPVAASFGERTISLPLWPGMTDADVDTVVSTLEATLTALR